MFTLIKEFKQAEIVSYVKGLVEEHPKIARFVSRALIDQPDIPTFQERWKQYDGDWSLAICIYVAAGIERRGLVKDKMSDEAYKAAFVGVLENPDKDFVVWAHYAMGYMNMREPLPDIGSQLSIWTFQDRAVAVSNPTRGLSDGSYFAFDPMSGLYHTDKEFSEQLSQIIYPGNKLTKLVEEFTGSDSFQHYTSSEDALQIAGRFDTCAVTGGPSKRGGSGQ